MILFHIWPEVSTKLGFCCLILWSAVITGTPTQTKVGSTCTVQNTRRYPGICTKLEDCSLSRGNKKVGILPTKCPNTEENLVCCRTVKRISRQKCEEYSLVFKKTNIKADKAQLSVFDCPEYVTTFISGGTDAQKAQFPHQAAIGYDVPETDIIWRCGGTLISPDFVLTADFHLLNAAHCIKGSKAPPIKVMLGDIRLPGPNTKPDPNRIEVPIVSVTVHPQYYPPLEYNDIALIKLAQPVNISRNIFPACLPNAEYHLDEVSNVEATGWGQLGAFDDTSEVLQSVWIKKFDDDCNKYFATIPDKKTRLPEGIVSSQFCAGDKVGQKDTCKGDSGGPITVHKDQVDCIFYVVGITSFGSSLCGYQQPGVYTNVQSYMDWIEDIVWPNSTYNVTNYPYETILNTTKIVIANESRNKLPVWPSNHKVHPTAKPPTKTTAKPPPNLTTNKHPLNLTTNKPSHNLPNATTKKPVHNLTSKPVPKITTPKPTTTTTAVSKSKPTTTSTTMKPEEVTTTTTVDPLSINPEEMLKINQPAKLSYLGRLKLKVAQLINDYTKDT